MKKYLVSYSEPNYLYVYDENYVNSYINRFRKGLIINPLFYVKYLKNTSF